MDHSSLNSEMATLVKRLTDRILPDEKRENRLARGWVKFVCILLGTVVWASFAILFTYTHLNPPQSKDSAFDVSKFDPYWIVIASLGSGLFIWLIYSSFERRSSLTFFFYGLLFPALAFGILNYSFGGMFK